MEEVGKKKKHDWKRTAFIVGMCIVPILHFLVFYLYVNFDSVMMAFRYLEDGELVWGMKNFKVFFQEFVGPVSEFRPALKNTIIFFCTSLFVVMPLTLMIAYFLYKKIAGYKFYRVMFFLPNILSAVVMTIVYARLVGRGSPIANMFDAPAGLLATDRYWLGMSYPMLAIVVYTIWTGFGTNLILMSGAMNRIPEEVLEAARLDGVGMVRELVQIILPMVWPTLTTLIVFTFVGIFTASGPILLFTKGQYDTLTISYWILSVVMNPAGDVRYASVVGLVFTIVALPIVLFVKWGMEKLQAATEY